MASRDIRDVVFRALLAIVLLLSACSKETPEKTVAPAKQPPSLKPASNELVVVSTNDFHAALQKAEGLASVIRALRKQYGDRMVYLDAGDQFQGSLEGNMNKGAAVIQFFNLLGLDAAALGNHELDYGPDVPRRVTVEPGEDGMGNLKAQMKKANYPMLSANLIFDPPVSCQPGPGCNALGQKTAFEPRKIFRRAGYKVCVIAGTTPATANITNPEFIKGRKFEDLTPVIGAEIKMMKEKERCDWLLLDVHEGLRYEMDGKTLRDTGLMPVLRALPPAAVDAVIGGHSHIRIQHVVNEMPVVQTGTAAQVVGVLHLFHDDGKKTYRFAPFVPVPDTAVAFDVTSLLEPYRAKAFQYKRQVVASSIAPFPQDKVAESALGNLMADAVLAEAQKYGGGQFALMNAGGIRSKLPAGKITFDHIFRLMPFDNDLVIAELTGAELRSLLSLAFSGALGMPSISGLRVTILRVTSGQRGSWDRDLNHDGHKDDWERNVLVDVRDAAGRPLQDDKIYKLATNSFLAEGGDYQDLVYDQIPPARIHMYPVLIRDIFADYFKKNSPLKPQQYYSTTNARIKLIPPPG